MQWAVIGIPPMPFKGFPQWGRGVVKWGDGYKGAMKRIETITEAEAKQIEADKVGDNFKIEPT